MWIIKNFGPYQVVMESEQPKQVKFIFLRTGHGRFGRLICYDLPETLERLAALRRQGTYKWFECSVCENCVEDLINGGEFNSTWWWNLTSPESNELTMEQFFAEYGVQETRGMFSRAGREFKNEYERLLEEFKRGEEVDVKLMREDIGEF